MAPDKLAPGSIGPKLCVDVMAGFVAGDHRPVCLDPVGSHRHCNEGVVVGVCLHPACHEACYGITDLSVLC